MCALTAGQRGRRVLLLDHAHKPGDKIRISGGGRCNFTNLHTTPAHFLSNNPHFCISALESYTQHDFIALVESHGIAWHEKTLGQLFCDGSAQQVIDLLLDECRAGGVELRLGTVVDTIKRSAAGGFELTVAGGGALAGTHLVIATGGKSIPKMGATGFAYRVAEQFGLPLVTPRAGLVPLTFAPELKRWLDGMSGVAVDAEVRCGDQSFAEALLFTHRGLSGPVILQISSYWQHPQPLAIDLAPGTAVFDLLKRAQRDCPRQQAASVLADILPRRLAQLFAAHAGAAGHLAELADATLRSLADHIRRWTVLPAGTEGFRKAEVTVGGVDTAALDSRDMQVKPVPGLFFIGEALDVTGHLGGHNFQWAWSSGHAAGRAV